MNLNQPIDLKNLFESLKTRIQQEAQKRKSKSAANPSNHGFEAEEVTEEATVVPLCKGWRIMALFPDFEVLCIMKLYLICPTCGSDDVMKNGMTRRGKQNHKCRDCGRQFVENPQAQPKGPDTLSKNQMTAPRADFTSRDCSCHGRFRELATKRCESALWGRRTQSLGYSKGRGEIYGPNG